MLAWSDPQVAGGIIGQDLFDFLTPPFEPLGHHQNLAVRFVVVEKNAFSDIRWNIYGAVRNVNDHKAGFFF